MGKKAIIHISDLHVMLHTEENGEPKKTSILSISCTFMCILSKSELKLFINLQNKLKSMLNALVKCHRPS